MEGACEFEAYRKQYGDDYIVVCMPDSIDMTSLLPEGNPQRRICSVSDGVGYARLFTQLLAYALGINKAWLIDDNVRECALLNTAEFLSWDQRVNAGGQKFRPYEHNALCDGVLPCVNRCSFADMMVMLEAQLLGMDKKRATEFADLSCTAYQYGVQGKCRMFNEVQDMLQRCDDTKSYFNAQPGKANGQGPYTRGEFSGKMSDIALIGTHIDATDLKIASEKGRFFGSAHVSCSFCLLNVTLTVEKRVFFPSVSMWEDLEFGQICREAELAVVKCNIFSHVKSDLSRGGVAASPLQQPAHKYVSCSFFLTPNKNSESDTAFVTITPDDTELPMHVDQDFTREEILARFLHMTQRTHGLEVAKFAEVAVIRWTTPGLENMGMVDLADGDCAGCEHKIISDCRFDVCLYHDVTKASLSALIRDMPVGENLDYIKDTGLKYWGTRGRVVLVKWWEDDEAAGPQPLAGLLGSTIVQIENNENMHKKQVLFDTMHDASKELYLLLSPSPAQPKKYIRAFTNFLDAVKKRLAGLYDNCGELYSDGDLLKGCVNLLLPCYVVRDAFETHANSASKGPAHTATGTNGEYTLAQYLTKELDKYFKEQQHPKQDIKIRVASSHAPAGTLPPGYGAYPSDMASMLVVRIMFGDLNSDSDIKMIDANKNLVPTPVEKSPGKVCFFFFVCVCLGVCVCVCVCVCIHSCYGCAGYTILIFYILIFYVCVCVCVCLLYTYI